MKKSRILSLLLIPAFACGCSAKNLFAKPKPNFDSSYTVQAEIEYGKFSANADITRNGTGDYIFCFTSPDYLMGMSLALGSDGICASLGSISAEVEGTSAYTAIPELIAGGIDALGTVDGDTITEQDGVLTLNTEACDSKMVITTDTGGGLLPLKCPSRQLSVKFSNQTAAELIETAEETLEIII